MSNSPTASMCHICGCGQILSGGIMIVARSPHPEIEPMGQTRNSIRCAFAQFAGLNILPVLQRVSCVEVHAGKSTMHSPRPAARQRRPGHLRHEAATSRRPPRPSRCLRRGRALLQTGAWPGSCKRGPALLWLARWLLLWPQAS